MKGEMAEVDSSDYCSSLDKSVDKLTLFEKRDLAANEVQALELEEELADLEEKKRGLLKRLEHRRRTGCDYIYIYIYIYRLWAMYTNKVLKLVMCIYIDIYIYTYRLWEMYTNKVLSIEM